MRYVTVIPWALGALFMTGAAEAEPLFDLSGRVALLDGAVPSGVHATVGLDLDRDGTLNSFELVNIDIGDDGSYAVSYTPDPTKVDFEFIAFVTQLAANYEQNGFDAVLEDGPLPVVVKLEREGYSTVVKRFTTLSQAPTLNVVMAPLATIGCTLGVCSAGDGSVSIQGFPGGTGIDRAFASAYDPGLDTRLFPGAFTDTSSNLLVSSGFTQINLHDANGNKVTSLSSPVTVRFRANPASYATLRDLSPGSSGIEVPMYSFDEDVADWVAEANGELVDADGVRIAEDELDAIHDGSYQDPVYISFLTRHFSTFNCDAPITRRACVKGRIVTDVGDAIANVQVAVSGVSYTGSAGTVVTGVDGYFASDLMKSELSSEDVDNNGKQGETFRAQVAIDGALGVYVGASFDTPTVQGTIGRTTSCRPADCDCVDIGDIVPQFELPRACTITVRATYSGRSTIGSGGPLAEGDAVVGATLSGQLTGSLGSGPANAAACAGEPCGAAAADASGQATFVVPVLGDEPHIQVKASYQTKVDGTLHWYDASATVQGCASGDAELSGSVDLELTHMALDGLGDFIGSLGSGPSSGGTGGGGGLFDDPLGRDDPAAAPSCGCRTAGSSSPSGFPALFISLAAVGALGWRRRGAPTA